LATLLFTLFQQYTYMTRKYIKLANIVPIVVSSFAENHGDVDDIQQFHSYTSLLPFLVYYHMYTALATKVFTSTYLYLNYS